MNLLVLGGTIFLGRHIVEEALRRGHEVSILNRGEHFPELFPDVEKLRVDRRGDLDQLERVLRGRRWDMVIDTSGHFPRDVRASARLLADSGHYLFVSSINVYPDYSVIGLNEESETFEPAGEEVTEMTHDAYGALKVACEMAAEREMPGRTTSVRAGLIVGRYDFSDRFTYWPYRVARGGEVIAPGDPQRPIQIIDVRDLADWCLDASERRIAGAFNVTGPDRTLTMGEMLETCREVSKSDAEIEWVDEETLAANNVEPWKEMPLWLPKGAADGVMAIDIRKALDAGLTFRPLADTVAYTLEWARSRSEDHQWRAGLWRGIVDGKAGVGSEF